MSINNHNEQSRRRAEVLELGWSDVQRNNQAARRAHNMWESIKRMYWSPIGVSTTVLHNVTLLLALLAYMGWHQIWYGVPAFSGAGQTVVASRGK